MERFSPQILHNAIREVERSIAQGEYTEARRMLKRFMRFDADRGTKFELQLLLGKSYVSEGKWKKALEILSAVAPAAARGRSSETAAFAHHYIGDCHIYRGDVVAAGKSYNRSLKICEQKNISGIIHAHNLSAVALIDRLHGKYAKALANCRQAVPIYEALSEKLYHADALINCAQLESFLGETEAAIADAKEAHSLLSRTGHKPRAVDCLWLLGILLILNKGDFAGGLDYMEQAIRESGEIGGLEVFRIYCACADALTKIGAFDDARVYCEQALAVANRFNYGLGIAQCHIMLARIRRLEDDYVATLHFALEAKELFRNAAYHIGAARALVYEAEVHIHNGQFEKAKKALKEAKATAGETDDVLLKSDCAVAELLLLMGQNKSGKKLTGPLREFSGKVKDRWWYQYLKVRYHLAILLLLEGESAEASEIVRELLGIIRKTVSALPEEYRASFVKHPVTKRVMELNMRVGFKKALEELAPEETLKAVGDFSSFTSKPKRSPAGIRARTDAPFELVYESSQMQEVVDTARKIATSEIPVLIIGETGVGKEILARFINHHSRRKGRFVPLNCAAMPPSLIESELFGYAKGAFTGADTDKEGLLLVAHDGTLFLDEIGNMPPDMQVKMLRVLEENRIRPVGSTKEKEASVRLLSATNRDLKTEMEKGRFREDLYYRINVVTIKLPPLRKRRDDILVLINHFLEKSGEKIEIEKEALDSLVNYDWPGNVRELKNEVARLVSMSEPTIRMDTLKEEILKPAAPVPVDGSLQDMERKMIEDLLKATGYNKQKTAKLLGISRTTLYRKLKRHNITCPEA